MTSNMDSLRARKPKAVGRRGMTLVEILMAMFVLVFVFGGVISSVVRAASLTRDSKVVYRETAIMNDLVERMRSMTFAELKAELNTPSKNEGNVPPPSGTGNEKVLAGAYTYKWKRACSDINADPLRIVVNVWPEKLETKGITLVTYISASGLINKEE